MSSSSSMGSALSYNEDKVREGEAEVIEEVNVDRDHLSIHDTFARLETRNIRSKDVSFHMSVNPAEGEKLSKQQIKELVSDIMKGLGYEKQPYIIYRHDDIGRTHYHVVSIRTDHNGKKITECLSIAIAYFETVLLLESLQDVHAITFLLAVRNLLPVVVSTY